MPLFDNELNESVDNMARAGRVWLHTAAPTNASPAANRTSVGGGAYEAGFAVTAGNWSVAASGDVQLDVRATSAPLTRRWAR